MTSTLTPANSSDLSALYPGQRFGSIIRLRPEHAVEYKRYHAEGWPEVKRQITDCNIHDYVIYYDADSGVLFSSFKYTGSDFDADMVKMRGNPKVREWWKLMDSFQESLVPGATSSESGHPSWWKPIEEVFYQA
ncbi:hypothetical protein BMF94_1115 [Rhodotorula taiwanensis]|uniref:L-rhamnose mutarotase n=1 Tax=Rhodotorula taiwanensis TaxID=741276 RepID=A0A2S5BGB3_9BASI|nr:hypothetical protein BMF94_1115 [Rhodotorula taiwanensis]